MRQISGIQFVLFVTCLSYGIPALLHAQSNTKPGRASVNAGASKAPAGSKPPAARQDAEIELPVKSQPKEAAGKHAPNPPQIGAALEDLLARWEASSAKIKTLHGNQTRSEFNPVFNVEKRTKGRFFLETPDKGRIDMLPVKIGDKDVSEKKDATGVPYALETGQAERWICTGDSIMVINDADKTYSKDEIPVEQRGTNIVHSPLPFLFGMKADEAKMRFQLSLTEYKKSPRYVKITAVPLLPQDKENYETAWIWLDTKTFLPIQVHLQDQNKLDIIYKFEDVVVNGNGIKAQVAKLFGGEADPYHPNMKNYKEAQPPAAVPVNVAKVKPVVGDAKQSPKPKGDLLPPSGAQIKQTGGTRTAPTTKK